MVPNLCAFFFLLKKNNRKLSPNIKNTHKVFSSVANLNIQQARDNVGSHLELCLWPPGVLKSNIRFSPNSILVNSYSKKHLCLLYIDFANSAPFNTKPCDQILPFPKFKSNFFSACLFRNVLCFTGKQSQSI